MDGYNFFGLQNDSGTASDEREDCEVECHSNVTYVYHKSIEEYSTWCKADSVRDYLEDCQNNSIDFPWVRPSINPAIATIRNCIESYNHISLYIIVT